MNYDDTIRFKDVYPYKTLVHDMLEHDDGLFEQLSTSELLCILGTTDFVSQIEFAYLRVRIINISPMGDLMRKLLYPYSVESFTRELVDLEMKTFYDNMVNK